MFTMGFRKTRSDCSLEIFANIKGFDENACRNEYGRKTRKDKLIGTFRKEADKKKYKYTLLFLTEWITIKLLPLLIFV